MRLNISKNEINNLDYKDPNSPDSSIKIPKGSKALSKLFISMYSYWSQDLGTSINIEDVQIDDFCEYRTAYNPDTPMQPLHAVATPIVPVAPIARPPALTLAQQFNCCIKKDKEHSTKFNKEQYWDNFRQRMETTAGNHGTTNILDGTYIPTPRDETNLFQSQN